MYGLNDLVLESARAAVLAALLLYLVVRSRASRFGSLPGARPIIAGFGLMLFATLLDITDEIPGLERFVVIGATETEAYIETFCGYLAAFVTLFVGFVKIIPSIAKLEVMGEELRESEEKFRSVFETIPDVVSITRLDNGLVVDVNPSIEELSGLPREHFLGRSTIEMNTWGNLGDRERMVRGVLENGAVRNMEVQLRKGNGDLLDCLVSARLMQLHGASHILAVFKDISERKRVEEALHQSEATFRKLFSDSSNAILLIDSAGVFVECNQAALDLLKMTREQFLQLPPARISPEFQPDGRRSAESAPEMIALAYSKGLHRFDWTCVNAEGGEFIVEVSLMPIVINGQTMLHTTWRDITARKLVEKALQESEARFRLIFAASPDPLVLARADGGGIIDVNRAFEAETGISRKEALGKTSTELNIWVEPAERDEFLGLLRRDGIVSNFEARLCTKAGELRKCLVSAQLVELGGTLCMLLDSRDITRQKQAEAVLLEMDRMKSDFISTAAHELRTPLATMLGYTELLAAPDDFGGFSDEQRKEFLAEIYLKGETLSRIIDEMLDISRIESGQSIALDCQPHELRALLSKIVQQFQVQSPKHAFRIEFPGKQPEVVDCDLHRITQVLENLLSNAVKYSPRGGTVTARGEIVAAAYVIGIADKGIGMTPEQQARAFDKFYRADSSNTAISGLGLGMSIARQIVEAHGGRIWVESEPGRGTKVSFSLPLT